MIFYVLDSLYRRVAVTGYPVRRLIVHPSLEGGNTFTVSHEPTGRAILRRPCPEQALCLAEELALFDCFALDDPTAGQDWRRAIGYLKGLGITKADDVSEILRGEQWGKVGPGGGTGPEGINQPRGEN